MQDYIRAKDERYSRYSKAIVLFLDTQPKFLQEASIIHEEKGRRKAVVWCPYYDISFVRDVYCA